MDKRQIVFKKVHRQSIPKPSEEQVRKRENRERISQIEDKRRLKADLDDLCIN